MHGSVPGMVHVVHDVGYVGVGEKNDQEINGYCVLTVLLIHLQIINFKASKIDRNYFLQKNKTPESLSGNEVFST